MQRYRTSLSKEKVYEVVVECVRGSLLLPKRQNFWRVFSCWGSDREAVMDGDFSSFFEKLEKNSNDNPDIAVCYKPKGTIRFFRVTKRGELLIFGSGIDKVVDSILMRTKAELIEVERKKDFPNFECKICMCGKSIRMMQVTGTCWKIPAHLDEDRDPCLASGWIWENGNMYAQKDH